MLTLERTTSAFDRFGICRSYGYQLISRGLFPPPVNKDEKPSRVLSEEIDTLIKAKAAGVNNDQIRDLVAEMVRRRKTLWHAERDEEPVQEPSL